MTDKDQHCPPNIPEEIMREIMGRAEVKTLSAAKCVSKRLKALVEEHKFVLEHMERFNKFNALHLGEWRVAGTDEHCDEEINPFKFYACHGMLLSKIKNDDGGKNYFVRNPATRRSLKLPESNPGAAYGVLFYIQKSCQYKLLNVYLERDRAMVLDVITPGVDDSWRSLEIPKSHAQHPTKRMSVFPADEGFHIYRAIQVEEQIIEEVISFDLEKESFLVTTLTPGFFSDWRKVSPINWEGKPALAEIRREDLNVLVITEYKEKHLMADRMRSLPLGRVKDDMQQTGAAPMVFERGLLWFKRSNNRTVVYDTVTQAMFCDQRRASRPRFVLRQTMANLNGMQFV